MKTIALRELAEFVMGQAPPGEACNHDGLGTPFVKAGEFGDQRPIIREWTTRPIQLAQSSDILVCVVGATAGKVNLGIDCAIGRSVGAVRPITNRLDQMFVYQFLRAQTNRLRSGSQGSAQGVITRGMLESLQVPDVPLPEQRRIADILDKADAIRRKRKEAIALTEELLRSAFLEMFGDPVTNPKGWPTATLGDEASQMKYGTSEKCGPESSGSLPVLRIPNVVGGEIDWADLKHASLDPREADGLRLQRGDLLFVRSNGNPDYIGRCAVYDSERVALFASYLIRVRLNAGRLHPTYVRAALSSATYRTRLTGEARTTAGNYNINTEGLRRLELPLPPMVNQTQFVEFDAATRQSCKRMKLADQNAELAFFSLVQQMFTAGDRRSC